ncbi:hypothetical protein NIES2101_43395 [Calothrix sp. HK-06]|nr:hypothetical protein NIES2101_43395 [Calothrix sp. HK-06]
MSVYTTEKLIEILHSERQACLKGQRLKLDVTVSGSPVLDQFIRSEGLQKFTAYQDFKAAIHQYQRDNNVSGIVWRSCTVKSISFKYPEVDAQLVALPEDIEILKNAKSSIWKFWQQATVDMDLFLSVNHGKLHQLITKEDCARIQERTEWAGLLVYEKSNFLEIVLQLGWGKPEEACYKRGFPASGSEYIHAVNPGQHPIT